MELIRRRAGLWLVVFLYGWCFGFVSCFGPNLDSEFTFLLPAGRTECFFQTAIKNGTMEVEYQVTAKVVRKQTLALSQVTLKCLYGWNLTRSQLFMDASLVQIRFPVSRKNSELMAADRKSSFHEVASMRLKFGLKVSHPLHIWSSYRRVCACVRVCEWVGGGKIPNYWKDWYKWITGEKAEVSPIWSYLY